MKSEIHVQVILGEERMDNFVEGQIFGHKSTVTVFEKKGLVNCVRIELGKQPSNVSNPAGFSSWGIAL